MPAGDKTGPGAPTGLTVYESNKLGEEFRGLLLSEDSGKNTVFGYRTSPDGARITTYRVDLASHAQDGDWNGTCAGEAAYRLNLTVDYREAMRVAVYEEGRAASCGGTGCSAVMADEQRRWWANGTV